MIEIDSETTNFQAYKSIDINGVECSIVRGYEKYAASKDGCIYNIKTKKELINGKFKEYGRTELSNNDGKFKKVQRSNIIVFAWISESPSHSHTVDHIDNNSLNNNVENLRWATKSEQTINRKDYTRNDYREITILNLKTQKSYVYRGLVEAAKEIKIHHRTVYKIINDKYKQPDGYRIYYTNGNNDFIDLDGEEWKFICNKKKKEMISNKGRYKSRSNKLPHFGTLKTTGYHFVVISGKNSQINRLVYSIFKEEIPENYVVNHIDGNKQNNYVENLEAITYKENSTHAVNVLGKNTRKKTQLTNKITKEVKIFDSLKEASEYLSAWRQDLGKAIKNNRLIKNEWKGKYV